MIDRRSFLRNVGGGMLLAGGLPLLGACGGVKRDDLAAFDDGSETIKGLERDDLEILYLASLAPSGHNAQPWAVKVVGPKHWVVGSDAGRWLPAVDPDNREMLLAIGAFIGNLEIAAGTFGYDSDVRLVARDPKETHIADIRLKKSGVRPFDLQKIRKRRTVRSGFSDVDIKTEDLRFITSHDASRCMPGARPPHSFYFSNNSAQGRYLQGGTIEANRKQAYRDPAQEELANWIRWSNREAKERRNGLTPESMDISGATGLYVRTFYNRRSVLGKSFREQTIDIVAKQVQRCGGWLVVTSQESIVPTLIDYGRVFEGMFLKIRERMIAMHPITQMLEETPSDEVARGLGLSGRVEWLLRLGYLQSYPEPVSLRMPPSWFVRA